jgi:lincosamide nucleotidyltransferase A/C/D/E
MSIPDYSQPIENEPKPLMRAPEVFDVYVTLEKEGVQIWIEGGWGVDALLGKETRPHKDLDIAIQWNDVQRFGH